MVFRADHTPHPGIQSLLTWLRRNGLAWVLLTGDGFAAAAACAAAGLPAPALHLSPHDLPGREPRGNARWLTHAAELLGLRANQLLMVGSSQVDWYTGIHAHVLYVHARWADVATKDVLALTYEHPDAIRTLLENFLLAEPDFAFCIDDDVRAFRLRALLPPNVRLPASTPASFTLQDVFTYDRPVTIAGQPGRDVLMLHLLCSAYLDGALPAGSLQFCVYPSSTPGKGSPQLAAYLELAKTVVGSYFKADLLERVVQAPDTSLERVKARRTGIPAGISIATQAQSVRINPRYRRTIPGKTIVVFDDFTTSGMSLDWARTLLAEAGAAEVIALTIGKYPGPYTYYTPRPGVRVDPFSTNTLTGADFTTTTVNPGMGPGPAAALQQTIHRLIAQRRTEAAAPTPTAGKTTTPTTGPAPAAPGRLPHPRTDPPGRPIPEPPYRTPRERHLGEQLARLQAIGYLTWLWENEIDDYWDDDPGPMWWIAGPGHADALYDLEAAELVVEAMSAAAGRPWKPASPAEYAPAPRSTVGSYARRAPLGGVFHPRSAPPTGRERRLGEQLDRLQVQRILIWRRIEVPPMSWWWIVLREQPQLPSHYELQEAEDLVARLSQAHGIPWPHAEPAAPKIPAGPSAPERSAPAAPSGQLLPMPPFRIARQRHLAEQLNALQRQGRLSWRGAYLLKPRTDGKKETTTALWWIALSGEGEKLHETPGAEEVVARMCEEAGIIWEPVPHPGGKRQLDTTLARIQARRALQG
nr:hypothetical protein KPHV_87540 [Kitasatospora purpeofusca]